MLAPFQLSPPSPDVPIRQDGPDDGRVERAPEVDGRRKAPDEFSAVFAALACQAKPVPGNETFQSNGEDGTAAAAACVAEPATDDAAPAVTAEADATIEEAAAGLSFTTDVGGPPPGFAAAGADAVPTAPAGATGRPEIAATNATGGPAATGDVLAAKSPGPGPGPGNEVLVHVLVHPAAVGAAAADQSANLEVTAGSSAAPGDSVADGQSGMTVGTPWDASDRHGDAPHRDKEHGAEPQKATVTHAYPAKDGFDAASATLPQPHARAAEGRLAGAPDRTYQPAHYAAELIRQSLPQVAEAARLNGHGTIEITLSPEELGHVRLTIHSDDGATATVRLSADRHETLDLMRRHVDLLAQDMRDLGYHDLSFSFQDRPQRGSFDFNPPGGEIAAQADQLPSLEARVGLARASARHSEGSLDLRL